MKCKVEGCMNDVSCKNFCGKHYKRWWRHGDSKITLVHMNEGAECSVEHCNRPAKTNTLCKKHYSSFWRYGRTYLIRTENGKGRPLTTAGYVLLTVDGKRKYEHIHIAEKALGRSLPSKACVHHMNSVPWDNFTPYNLVICPDQAYHMLLHKRGKIK